MQREGMLEKTAGMTEEERQAIYSATVNSVVRITRMAKTAGLTGEQVWDCTKAALMGLFDIPESMAAFLVREAWEQAATEDTFCTGCGLNINTTRPCPDCGERLCHDCMGFHICDPE